MATTVLLSMKIDIGPIKREQEKQEFPRGARFDTVAASKMNNIQKKRSINGLMARDSCDP